VDEHDDDMTSEVHEGADLETDSFPDMEDELDDEPNGDHEDDEDADDDEDKSEM
jgi:hypothetical protein